MRLLRAVVAAALLAMAVAPKPAHAADDFANKRIRILVPFAAGGLLDILARLLAEKLSAEFGPRAIVENRPGAGGIIASRELLSQPADGHTLLVVAGGHALNPLMYGQLPYDTLNDFTPIALLAGAGNVIVVPANSPYKTLGDALKAAKDGSKQVTYGTAGVGTSVHLSGELIKHMAGVNIVPVHFKGDSESMTNVIGGHIAMSINTAPIAIAQIKQGTVRALAVTSAKRSSHLPNVPAVAETVAGYDVVNWWGVVGPGKMPAATVGKLNAAIRKAMDELGSTDRLKQMSIDVSTGPAQDFDKLIRNEISRWSPVVKAAGIKLESK